MYENIKNVDFVFLDSLVMSMREDAVIELQLELIRQYKDISENDKVFKNPDRVLKRIYDDMYNIQTYMAIHGITSDHRTL